VHGRNTNPPPAGSGEFGNFSGGYIKAVPTPNDTFISTSPSDMLLESSHLPPNGSLKPRFTFFFDPRNCVQDPILTLVFKCDPNRCETNSILVAKKVMTAKAHDIWYYSIVVNIFTAVFYIDASD